MKFLLILIGFTMFWIVFAIMGEGRDQKNTYLAGKARDKDSISASLRKIRYCMTYDLRTIKWRRSLISACIVTSMLFLLVWRRLPSCAELLTHMLIITAVFSAVWLNFTSKISSAAVLYVDDNIAHIKNILTKNHSFILPNWS